MSKSKIKKPSGESDHPSPARSIGEGARRVAERLSAENSGPRGTQPSEMEMPRGKPRCEGLSFSRCLAMAENQQTPSKVARTWVARGFTIVEDVVYVGLGLLLGASALVLLVSGIVTFVHTLTAGTFPTNAVALLDRILLILLVVELLYRVQVSFREHALVPEPFLLVGLIAAIRRVLVLTAEFGQKHEQTEGAFHQFLIELIILTVLILVVTVSLVLVRRRAQSHAERL